MVTCKQDDLDLDCLRDIEPDLHLRQGPFELLAVLVVALGEGDHPLIVSSLAATLAVLGEPRP